MSGAATADGRGGSLRWRLSLTYAGVALLTALVLGGILLVMLQVHFSNREEQHLRAAADQAARDVVAGGNGSQTLEQIVKLSAFGLQTRVQLYGAGGALIADSGSPGAVAARLLGTSGAVSAQPPRALRRQWHSPRRRGREAPLARPRGRRARLFRTLRYPRRAPCPARQAP